MIVSRVVQLAFFFCAFMAMGTYVDKKATFQDKVLALIFVVLFLMLIVGIEVFFI